jgi:patatin-like phospholipase/acyl hydrolase
MTERFRILSLDGGGIKGAFTASVVAALEEDAGKSMADYFDLITGTSTGGIIALGLGLGLPAKDIVAFYQQHGPTIFPCTSLVSRWSGFFRWLTGPKHSHQVLKAALKQVLGDRKLGESKCRLVIPTYDANAGRIFLLKTAHHERFKYDYQAPMVDVALATAAAPTYFRAAPFPTHQNASYVDGGVWANCPALVGITEAVGFLNVPLEQIDVLSIGTTAEPFSIAQHKDSGVVQWNAGLINLMFEAQVQADVAQAKVLVGGRMHRINHMAPAGQFSLDNATPEKIEELVSLGRGEAVKKENIEVVRRMFLNETLAEKFLPCYRV